MQNEIIELRKQIRNLQRMLFGSFGVIVLSGLLAATNLQNIPEVIQARQFEVINDEGKPVVVLDAVSEKHKKGGRIRVHAATSDTGWDGIIAQIEGAGRDAGFSLWDDGSVIANLGQDEGAGFVGVTSYRKKEEDENRKRMRTAAALMASMDGDYQPKVFLIGEDGTPLMFPPSNDRLPLATWTFESRGRK